MSFPECQWEQPSKGKRLPKGNDFCRCCHRKPGEIEFCCWLRAQKKLEIRVSQAVPLTAISGGCFVQAVFSELHCSKVEHNAARGHLPSELQRGKRTLRAVSSECQGSQGSQRFLCSFMSEMLEVLVRSKKQESGNATTPICSRTHYRKPGKSDAPSVTCADWLCHLPCETQISSLLHFKYHRNSRLKDESTASPDLSFVSSFIFCIFCQTLQQS